MGVKLWEIGYGFESLNNWIVEAKDIDEALMKAKAHHQTFTKKERKEIDITSIECLAESND